MDRPAAISNAILATGHGGMWGLQFAPVTARLVAQRASRETPEHQLTPLRPDRFSSRALASPHPDAASSTAASRSSDEEITDEAMVSR